MSAAEPFHGAGGPAFGAATVGAHMSAAGPSQGANCSPAFGGSAAAEWVNEAASVGAP